MKQYDINHITRSIEQEIGISHRLEHSKNVQQSAINDEHGTCKVQPPTNHRKGMWLPIEDREIFSDSQAQGSTHELIDDHHHYPLLRNFGNVHPEENILPANFHENKIRHQNVKSKSSNRSPIVEPYLSLSQCGDWLRHPPDSGKHTTNINKDENVPERVNHVKEGSIKEENSDRKRRGMCENQNEAGETCTMNSTEMDRDDMLDLESEYFSTIGSTIGSTNTNDSFDFGIDSDLPKERKIIYVPG